ncbi:adenylate/guanylate cyclase domain-containing protein [Leptolyngbyaceae cyanobacterium UHCC 1019]
MNYFSKKLRLRTTLVLPFIVEILLAVGLVGYLSFMNGHKGINDLATQLRAEVTERVRDRVQSYVAIPQLVNRFNAQTVELGLLKFEDLQAAERYFWRQVQTFDSVGNIGFANAQGQSLRVGWINRLSSTEQPQIAEQLAIGGGTLNYYDINQAGKRIKLSKAVSNYDPRKRSFYTSAVKSGKPTWSDVYINQGYNLLQLKASYPYYDNSGNLAGVLASELGIEQIGRFLQALKVGDSGQIYIMEPTGELVATSIKDQPILIGKGKKASRIRAVDGNNRLMQASSKFLGDRFSTLSNLQQNQQLEMQLDGQRQFLQVSPFRDPYGLDWLIVVVVPEADFMGQINANTQSTILLSLIALAVAIGLGILTARWITRPVLRVTHASENIASGNLDQHITSSRIIEMGKLAAAFNSMAGQLKQSFTDLATRNADLQQSEARNQAFLTAIPDLILRISREGQYLDVVEAKNVAMLVAGQDHLGKHMSEVLPTTVNQAYAVAIRQTLQTGETQALEYQLTIEGQPQTYEARVVASGSDEVICIVRDITDRKRSEAALHQSEATNRALIAAIPDLLIRANKDGTYFQITGQDRISVHGSENFLIGNTVTESLPLPLAQQRLESIGQALQTQQLQIYEQQILINREPRDEEVRIVAIGADEVLIMVRDITDRKQAELALKQLKDSFARFFPAEYLKFLNKESVTHIQLGDHISKEMAVMFSDIRSFTNISESMTPQESFDFVNTYLQYVSPAIHRHNGIIVKYMGDGVMAIFPTRAEDAVQAGIAKLKKIAEYNQFRQTQGYLPIRIGIGIHIGHMMVGMVGEASRMQGDVLSNHVNLTSRLEGLTKFYGVSMVISGQILEQLSDRSQYHIRFLDEVIVQGKTEAIAVYEVMDGDPHTITDAKLQTQPNFAQGLEHYRNGELTEAQQCFEQVLKMNQLDKAAQLYLERIHQLLHEGIPHNWSGIWTFTQK